MKGKKPITIDFKNYDKSIKLLTEKFEQRELDNLLFDIMTEIFNMTQDKVEKAIELQKVNGKPVEWERTGKTLESLLNKPTVEKTGYSTYTVGLGFNNNITPVSKFLMFGTPRMKPSNHLINALFSKEEKADIQEVIEKKFKEYLS